MNLNVSSPKTSIVCTSQIVIFIGKDVNCLVKSQKVIQVQCSFIPILQMILQTVSNQPNTSLEQLTGQLSTLENILINILVPYSLVYDFSF